MTSTLKIPLPQGEGLGEGKTSFPAHRLLQHLNHISDTPDSIPRLRQFILDLAVRGKLTEQDVNDEPSSELLKRIQTEKEKLVNAGEVRREKTLLSVSPENKPFEIPTNWTWVPLGETVNSHFGGGTPSKSNPSYWDGDIYWASVKDVGKDKYIDKTIDRITQVGLDNSSSNLIPPGNLIVVTRMGIGKVAINRVSIAINQDLRALLFSKFSAVDYHFIFFKTQSFEGTGLTVKGIKLEELLNFPFPLPPLAEQYRIVAKVNELMTLCDQLEAAQKERESRRDSLVTSSLHRLNHPPQSNQGGEDTQTFREHARFYFNHLPRLTTRPEHIQQLRQTILNLAVRGKLVPQDPNDEAASELLRRIHFEQEQSGKGAMSRSRMALSTISSDKIPFFLPTSWQWVRFGELIIKADAGWSPKSEGFPRIGQNWGVLKVSAVSWDNFLPEENKQLLPGVIPPEGPQVHVGNFLISRANTSALVAKCVVVTKEPRNLILSDKIVRLKISENCDKKFLCMVNNHAEYARSYYAEEASGTSLSMKNVSREVIYELPIPFPPLAEQQRIIAKVDELLAVCDKVEGQLSTTQTDGRQLFDAILQEALTLTS